MAESTDVVTADERTAQQLAKIPLEAGRDISAIIPRTIEEAFRLAQLVCNAGLAPSSYDGKVKGEADPQKVVIGILKALEVGFPPITGLGTIMIVNNRPSIWGDGAMALCLRKGALVRHEVEWSGTKEKVSPPSKTDRGETDYTPSPADFTDDLTCIVRLWRAGNPEPFESKFSVRDAKRAHLWGNPKKVPWLEYPSRMLFNRARAFALRDGFADCLSGLSIAEEVQDLPPPPAEKADVSFLTDGVTGTLPGGMAASGSVAVVPENSTQG